MEASKKKPILIAIIVVCLVLAIVITVKMGRGSGGAGSLKGGEMMWVKCSNPDCEIEYEVDKKGYYTAKEQDPGSESICKECEEESLFRAVKCNSCGLIFFRGAVRGDFKDRCPECNYSQMEEDRKK